MSWVGNRPCDVYLGTRAVAIDVDGAARLMQSVEDWKAGLELLLRRLQDFSRRPRARFWLSGGLCRPFVFNPVDGISNAPERERAVRSVAAGRTGLAGPCDVWLDRASLKEPVVVAAIESACLSYLHKSLADRRVAAVSISPLWAGALNQTLRVDPSLTSFALQDCDSVTILCGSSGAVDMATAVAPVTDVETGDAVRNRALVSVRSAAGRNAFVRLVPDSKRPWASGELPLSSFMESVE